MRTCHFCNADIFISAFSCTSTECESVLAADAEIWLCTGCVVEGRSCECGSMEPVQMCEFDDVLGMYNVAAGLFGRETITDAYVSLPFLLQSLRLISNRCV